MFNNENKIILSDLLDRVEQLENSVLLLKNYSIGVNFVHYPVNSQLNLTDNNQIILANILPFQSNINTQFDVLILYDSISNVDVFCNLKIGDYESSNLIKQSTKNITNILLVSGSIVDGNEISLDISATGLIGKISNIRLFVRGNIKLKKALN
ncbi:MAG: hypothetical protein J6C13_02205 [Clostridia bacterium]|nr:hypothetical protein [Clostridia bacterium]